MGCGWGEPAVCGGVVGAVFRGVDVWGGESFPGGVVCVAISVDDAGVGFGADVAFAVDRGLWGGDFGGVGGGAGGDGWEAAAGGGGGDDGGVGFVRVVAAGAGGGEWGGGEGVSGAE